MIQRALIEAHLVLGLGLLGLVAVIVLVAAPAALRGKAPPPHYPLLHRAATLLIAIQVVLGILLFAGGRRPRDTLHLVYAVAAVLVMPVAWSMVRREQSRARLYQLGGTVLLLGVIFRLATTG